MGKKARIKRERAEGKRKPNGKRWNDIQPGFTLIIPTFDQVKRGATPVMIPTPNKKRGKIEDE
jgi:hypothetical protein